jgi:hypothetical protein
LSGFDEGVLAVDKLSNGQELSFDAVRDISVRPDWWHESPEKLDRLGATC